MAKQKSEQKLRRLQFQTENEWEEIKFRLRLEALRFHSKQQHQEQKLSLQLQQPKDELLLQQHEREINNNFKKRQEQKHLRPALNNGSLRASVSVADKIEGIES